MRRISVLSAVLTLALCVLYCFFPPFTDDATISVSRAEPVPALPESVELGLGDSLQLRVGSLFASDNENVAVVSEAGLVSSIAEGDCIITVTDTEGIETFVPVTVLPAPEGVMLTYPDDRVGAGEYMQVVARAYMRDGSPTAASFVFDTSDRAVATVTSDGVILGRKVGRAKITVTTYNGLTDTFNITVRTKPKSVYLDADSVELGVGEEYPLAVRVTSGSAGQYDLYAAPEGVVEIIGRSVLAVGAGQADVIVTTYNGMTARCSITVKNAPEGLALAENAWTLGVGQSFTPEYEILGEGAGGGVTVLTGDTSVAAVDTMGRVTAVGEGECDITVTTYNGFSATGRLVVKPAPESLRVSPGAVNMGVGEQYVISPVIDPGAHAEISYSSSDKSVCTVAEDGEISARKQGSAVITVKSHNGLKASVKVTVKKRPSSVRFRYDPITVYVGESEKALVKLTGGSASALTYSSSDRSVARVDSSGRVTGVAEGTAVISVSTYNSLSAECTVYVYNPPAAIDAPETIDAVAGVPMALPVSIKTEDGGEYAGETAWEAADPDIAYVQDGMLMPLRHGETYLTLTAHDMTRRIDVSVARYSSLGKTEVAAHRGYGATENSLESLVGANEAGADYVEIDVRKTKDGEIVLMHDSTITRTSGSSGYVSKKTLAELRQVDFGGTSVCTLDEALAYVATTDLKVLLELKITGIEEDCAKLVMKYGLEDRVTYISFHISVLTDVRSYQPGAHVGYLYSADIKNPVELAVNYNVDIMLPYSAFISEPYVSALHARGVRVGVWTVNKAKTQSSVWNAGVDVMITDKPVSALRLTGR